MKPRFAQALAALDQATLAELQQRFPEQWQQVGSALTTAAETRRPEAVAAWLTHSRASARPWYQRLDKPRANAKDLAAALPHLAAARMAKLATEQVLHAAAAQAALGPEAAQAATQDGNRVRFGWWSGTLIQRLMFARGLTRKPVSMAAFRLLWPLIPQRRLLMPLVQPRGIYCFYSRTLIRELARLIGDRSCLEVAAGDGTLTRFLVAAGSPVRAVDDQSWAHAITYPAEVEKLDAQSALRRDRPRVVLCSFPPPNNTFERAILRTPEVELYIVVTSRHRFAAGDWSTYQSQATFTWAAEPRLSRLVLPPELDPQVLLFRRAV